MRYSQIRTIARLVAMLVIAACTFQAKAEVTAEQALAAYEQGNFEEAFTLWQTLADGGNEEAQFQLGLMYDKGQGVNEDPAAAVQWYTRAAEAGHIKAQHYLGILYEYGRGVEKDLEMAKQWYAKAGF